MFFSMTELYTQIVEIERLLNETQEDCVEIPWEKHHPDYPKSLFNLMRYIAKSNWVYGEYKKHELKVVMENINSASLEQIQCAFTRLNRSEKWCTGSWIQVMKDGTLEPLIKRGKELTTPEKSSINRMLARFSSTKT
jgi:hypothetical protein